MLTSLSRLLCVVALLVLPVTARAADMERGVAITDPALVSVLDRAGLNLGNVLGAPADVSSASLFALPSMTEVRDATDRDFNAYVITRKDSSEPFRLFDRDALNSDRTRFALVGVVNRMDRAYVSPETCGEIRLIYRPIAMQDASSLRLPMTLSVILNAKPAGVADPSCRELARRWLVLSDVKPADAESLTASGGALQVVTREAVNRIELNIQVARAAADANDFEGRADYLMKVFRYDSRRQHFVESPMENQIDAERIGADATLAADFRQWILDPAHLADLDRGTIVLPDRFLATSVINQTPSQIDGEDVTHKLFSDQDVVAALRVASTPAPLENIRSPAGFARRLDDITCAGCHRTRAIGGFHFPGAEQQGLAASPVVAAASPHFFGDQERRRDVNASLRDGTPPDFSRSFSARPQARRAKELAGTTYVDGWGAQCVPPESADKSFDSWTCAEGLSCQRSGASRAGFCFPKN